MEVWVQILITFICSYFGCILGGLAVFGIICGNKSLLSKLQKNSPDTNDRENTEDKTTPNDGDQ